jgi:hypothetical protein
MKVMTGRAAFAVGLLAGCGAHLGGGDSDATPGDSVIYRDASSDGLVDGRPCTGGTTAMTGPDGSCFVFVATPKTYLLAKAACEAMNAHLAYIKSAALDTFAEGFIGAVDTWIGGSDRATEMTFVWEDGTPFVFTNWHTGEPNNGGGTYQEDCVIIAGARVDKQWDDRPCDATEVATSGNFAYLCNY